MWEYQVRYRAHSWAGTGSVCSSYAASWCVVRSLESYRQRESLEPSMYYKESGGSCGTDTVAPMWPLWIESSVTFSHFFDSRSPRDSILTSRFQKSPSFVRPHTCSAVPLRISRLRLSLGHFSRQLVLQLPLSFKFLVIPLIILLSLLSSSGVTRSFTWLI